MLWRLAGVLVALAMLVGAALRLMGRWVFLSDGLFWPIAATLFVGGLVLALVGGRASDSAFGAQVTESRRRSVRQDTKRRMDADSDRARLSMPVWGLIESIAARHRDTLAGKRRELVTHDDYGAAVTDRWDAELEYFWLKVVKPELSDCSPQAYRAAVETAVRETGEPEQWRDPERAMIRAVARRIEAVLDQPMRASGPQSQGPADQSL
ncbi:MAG: hypothetical protein AAGB51_05725 [Planctomycetota bacterium]